MTPAEFEAHRAKHVEPYLDRVKTSLAKHNLGMALLLASCGAWVFPCKNKIPRITGWSLADETMTDAQREKALARWRSKHPNEEPVHIGATRDPEVLVRMWRRYPQSEPAIACGPTGVVVVDPDKKDGGPEKITELYPGGIPAEVPVTRTGSGGLHLYYRNSVGLRGQTKAFRAKYGTDVKGTGGFVVAPGAKLMDGRAYQGAPGHVPLFEALLAGTLPDVPEHVATAARTGGTPDEDDPLYLPPAQTKAPGEPSERLREIVAAIPNDEDTAQEYDEWVRVLAGIHYETGGSDEGRELAEEWSTGSGKHDDDKFEKTWTSFGKTSSARPVTIGSLESLARQHGWKPNTDALGAVDDGGDDYGTDERPVGSTKTEAVKALAAELLSPYVVTPAAALPPRRMVYGSTYQRGVVSLLAAFGGRGKSVLTITEALAMASGRPLLGTKPVRALRVLVWNGEDSREELHRRVAAACEHYSITQDDIGDRLFIVSGNDVPVVIATTKDRQPEINTEAVKHLTHFLKVKRIDVALFDPVISLHQVSENDNTAMDMFTKTFVRLAAELDIAIGLATHVRKPSGKEEVITAHDIRGAGAVSAAVRVVRVLNPVSTKDAPKLGVPAGERWRYMVLSDSKGNYMPLSRSSLLLRTISHEVDNGRDGYRGDSTPVIERYEPKIEQLIVAGNTDELMNRLRAEDWLVNRQGKGAKRWAGTLVCELYDLDVNDDSVRERVAAELKELERNGVLSREDVVGANRKPSAVYRPGKVPCGAFAEPVDDEDDASDEDEEK